MSVQKQVRTTISLPAKSLVAAKRAAKSRKVNLSTVVAEALDQSLEQAVKQQERRERAEAIMARYRKAFSGFSDEEMLLLDGIIIEKKK